MSTRGPAGAAKSVPEHRVFYDEDERPVIFDMGSDTTKAGMALSQQEDQTTWTDGCAFFPTAVARRARQRVFYVGIGDEKDSYVGLEALERAETGGDWRVKRPVEGGCVTNWDDVEKVWFHAFYDVLRVAPEEHPVVLTERALNPKANREKATQIMFETFNTPALYVGGCAELALLAATGQPAGTGLVVDLGEDTSQAVPVVNGVSEPFAVFSNDECCGGALTTALTAVLESAGPEGDLPANFCRLIKETECRVEATAVAASDGGRLEFELPDGHKVSADEGLFLRCPEHTLFSEGAALPTTVMKSIIHCHYEDHAPLAANVFLAGGTAELPGLAARVQRDLRELGETSPSDYHDLFEYRHKGDVRARKLSSGSIKVEAATDNPRTAAWLGGALLACQSQFSERCTSKEDYDESGPVFHSRKVF
jgi:actin-related protein